MKLELREYARYTSLLFLAIGLFYQTATPFFLSVGGILFLLSSIWKSVSEATLPPFQIKRFLVPALWLIGLCSLLWSEQQAKGFEILTRQLVLVLIPTAVWLDKPNQKELLFFVNSFILLLMGFSLLTGIRYVIHLNEVKIAITESGAVPIWNGITWPWQLTRIDSSKFIESGINHIYFSILQVIGFWLLIIFRKSIRYSALYLLIVLTTLHWFFARTGLLAFYCSVGFYLFSQLAKLKISKKRLALMVASALIVFAIGSQLPGIRDRIENMQQDLKALQIGGDEINHRSFAMRWEAWKNAWWLIRSSPIIGVGLGDAEAEMQKAYELRNSSLYQENRIPPHNQYLETTLVLGILGFILLIAIVWITLQQCKASAFAQALAMALFAGMLMESILQTQLGVTMFAVFITFSPYFRDTHDSL